MNLRENSLSYLDIKGQKCAYYDLNKIASKTQLETLPFSLKILLENLLRHFDGVNIREQDIQALLNWSPKAYTEYEINFTPSRVILQDFTGVPAIVDLAAMREAMSELKHTASKINPLSPVELVIDHSVMVDDFGTSQSFQKNTSLEFSRNKERYLFLRWGQTAFNNFKVVPPGTGIVHQVNLEYLARVVFSVPFNQTNPNNTAQQLLYPDTLVGTDSHTTMINGLGVLGWGVGGIEAEAAMLGQPVTMLIPEVIGVHLSGQLQEGTTATDLVLTVTELLRNNNVVGKFVEFFGQGLSQLPLADRATIANMAPEYGATCGMFPIDHETLNYLELSGRSQDTIQRVEQYAKAQTLFRTDAQVDPQYNQVLKLDLGQIEPCIAGPKRPQDRITLKNSKATFAKHRSELSNPDATPENTQYKEANFNLKHGDVVIAAITSCTNTSNPDVMLAAGLIAKKAVALGLRSKPWVKTSLAPGSKVVTEYLEKAKLMRDLETLGFNLVGYGCTTCIGNSGPLPEPIETSIKKGRLAVSAVLSGNRNFEGRIHPHVRFAYLASPPLVVAYALAGTMDIDFYKDPLGQDKNGKAVYLKDLWPSRLEIQELIKSSLQADLFSSKYADVFQGDQEWQNLQIPLGERFAWDEKSTYIKHPPYFENFSLTAQTKSSIQKARVLALLGDSVTTDHISPAGDIDKNSPAGQYLQSLGVAPQDFNSYGSRRGNHEVMVRGTFANIRLKNLLLNGVEGGMTLYFDASNTNKSMSIYEASRLYLEAKQDLIILAGKEYGTGSSRDWAAKGTRLLGVKAVIAESFERIHRSNLIGMGVIPLQFKPGENAKSLNLTGHEVFSINLDALSHRCEITVTAHAPASSQASQTFKVLARIDTPKELEYYLQGGILPYVLKQLALGK
ncbi:MAG: aconitate hydratase AcnA [Gammaproteobacteria bacterium]